MSFIDWIFGKKPSSPKSTSGANEGPGPGSSQPAQTSPEFSRAIELQRSYWTHNADEQLRLESREFDSLSWRERLRLHHLTCLQRRTDGQARAAATEKSRQIVGRLTAADSPYRPRIAMIWQGNLSQGERQPDLQGDFYNASITHLGCLEYFLADTDFRPISLEFVSFDELSGIMFAPPSLMRGAKLFYEDGRTEVVLVPLLYGITWQSGTDHDKSGQMTRFVAQMDFGEIGALGVAGMGVGHQDFHVRNPDGGSSLFGLGSIAEISFPLDMRDPRFDDKARSRGIDPDEVRRQAAERTEFS